MAEIGYIALGICLFIFGYQYAARRKRDQQLLGKSMDWHSENFNRLAEPANIAIPLHKFRNLRREMIDTMRKS